MSNGPPRTSRLVVAAVVMAATAAHTQSKELLEGVRVHRRGIEREAAAELEACLGSPKKPPCARAGAIGLLTGMLQLSQGDATGAAATLGRVAPPKALAAFHAWYLAQAQLWSGHQELAARTLARLRQHPGAPGWLTRRATLRLAEVQLDLGLPAKALGVLDAVSDPGPEVLLPRARARLARGQTSNGLRDLRALALQYPAHPHAAWAEGELQRRGLLTFSVEDRLDRAQRLLWEGRPRRTLEELAGLQVSQAQAARVALLVGQSLLLEGDEGGGLAELGLASAGPPEVAAEALALLARRLMKRGDNRQARATFAQLDQRYSGHRHADEAGYMAAWLAMNSGELEEATRAFAEFEVRHPASRRRDEARWFRAYSLFRLGRRPEMRDALQSLLADFPRSSLAPQALYWAARASELERPEHPSSSDAGSAPAADSGQAGSARNAPAPPEVAREYTRVISAFPGSYYALLAGERLRQRGIEPPPQFSRAPSTPAPPAPRALALALELGRAGLFRDQAAEVQQAVAGVSPQEALSWGQALLGIGEYGAAYSLAAKHLWGAGYTAQQPEALALLYPRAFRAAVEEASAQAQLDPMLAWAVMRRESAFRPEVTSVANARGLLQLIPPTAHSVAAELKIEPPAPDELYSPSTNLRLGTWYLAALLQRFGHEALAAAAYNAGAGAVLKWLAERGRLPLDEWVEEIPWRETRGYVKQVTADYFLYQQLYGENPGRIQMVLPAPRSEGVGF